MTIFAIDACVTPVCDCSDLQLDLVGCECAGTPRIRPSYDEQVEVQDRIVNALIDKAIEREERAEHAYWEAEQAKDLARGWSWDTAWGQQPMDEHVRLFRERSESVHHVLLSA